MGARLINKKRKPPIQHTRDPNGPDYRTEARSINSRLDGKWALDRGRRPAVPARARRDSREIVLRRRGGTRGWRDPTLTAALAQGGALRQLARAALHGGTGSDGVRVVLRALLEREEDIRRSDRPTQMAARRVEYGVGICLVDGAHRDAPMQQFEHLVFDP